MALSLTQAAKAAKISKSTLSVAVQKGRLSALQLADGSYQIEPVELFRVFPPKAGLTPSAEAVRPASEPRPNTPEPVQQNGGSALNARTSLVELDVLRAQVAAFALERELRDRERDNLVNQIDDLRHRLDQEQEERRALQRQIAPPIVQPAPQTAQERPVEVRSAAEPTKPSRGFLTRLLGL